MLADALGLGHPGNGIGGDSPDGLGFAFEHPDRAGTGVVGEAVHRHVPVVGDEAAVVRVLEGPLARPRSCRGADAGPHGVGLAGQRERAAAGSKVPRRQRRSMSARAVSVPERAD